MITQDDIEDLAALPEPIHFSVSETRGLEIYEGSNCIARTSDKGEARAFALALLIGQRTIAGKFVKSKLRLKIAHAALSYAIE